MQLTRSRLQKELDTLADANNRAKEARDAIYAHCESVYGVNPGDIDNDNFIDGCDGGCGCSPGMSADQFDKSMRDAMKLAGINPQAKGG